MRKALLIILTGFISLIVSAAKAQSLNDLQSLEWSNRLILIHTTTDTADHFRQQMMQQDFDIQDRHIIWFIVTTEKLYTNYPPNINSDLGAQIKQDWFASSSTETQVVFIGKDGGEKWRHSKLDLMAIFAEIDAMPMRREEMRRQ